jgi:hypothetical protein
MHYTKICPTTGIGTAKQPDTLPRFSPEAGLTPQPVLLRAGERLRFDIGSRTDLLLSDQSHGRAQSQMQVPPYFSRNTLHYGAETYVESRKAPTLAE